jgi:hypothetical protein
VFGIGRMDKMVTALAKRPYWAWLLISIATLVGCSKDGSKSDNSGLKNEKQQHTGELFVKILPGSPTSTDSLQAVYSTDKPVSWRWEKNGSIIENEQNPRLSTSGFARGDEISVIVVSGGKEGKASVTVANSTPEIRQVSFTPQNIFAGIEITAVPDAFDADGDEVRYSCKWFVNGEEIYEDSLSLKGERIKKGDQISVVITPSDNYGSGRIYRTQALTIPNAPPRFTSLPPVKFQDSTYTYTAQAYDPDGDAITYSLASSPKGMTIDSRTGRIAWPLDPEASGSHTVKIIARDSEGAETFQEYTLNITVPAGTSR